MITWKDFFDFGDDQPLKDAMRDIEGLKTVYQKMIAAVEESNSRVAADMISIQNAAAQLIQTVNKLNLSMESNQKTLQQTSESSEELVKEYNALKQVEADNTKTIAKLNSELQKLNKTRDSAKSNIVNEAGSINDLKARLLEAEKQYKALGEATDKAVREEHKKRVEGLSMEYRKANDILNQVKKSSEAAAGSYNELSQRVAQAARELRSMEGSMKGTSQEFKDLQKYIIDNTEKLKAWDKAIGDNKRNVGDYPTKLESIGTVAGKAFPQAEAALSGVNTVMKSGTLLAGSLAAGAVAIGKAFYEESVRVKKNLETVNSLTNLTGLELQNFAVKAQATAKVFDKEFNETIKAGNVIMQSFGVDGTEAFDAINQVMLRGVDINGDFLEQIGEYSTFIAEAGGSTQDLVDILLASEQAGVFSDKGLDTIKEATLRIRELTPATKDAIKGLGLNVKEIEKGLRSGTTSVLDVIKQVTNRMQDLPPISKEVGTAIADIFGGPGEDAGKFLVQLGKINKTQGDWTKSLEGSYKAQYELLQATEEYEQTLISTAGNFQSFNIQAETFWTQIKTVGLVVLSELSTAFTTVDERVQQFQQTLSKTKDIKLIQKEIDNLENKLEEGASTTEIIIDGILSLGNANIIASRQMDRASETVQKLAAARAALNKLLEEGKKLEDEETAKKIAIAIDAAKKLADAEAELYKWRLQQAIKYYEEIFANEANNLEKRTKASVEAERLRNKLIKYERDQELKNDELNEAQRILIKEKAEAKMSENRKNAAKERVNASLEELKFEAEVSKRIFDNDKNTYDQRINALLEYGDISLQILDQQLAKNLISEKEYAAEVERINQELGESVNAITLSNLQKQNSIIESELATALNTQITALNESFKKGEISVSEYNKQRNKLMAEGMKETLNLQIDNLEKELSLVEENSERKAQIERNISELRKQLSEQTIEQIIANEERLKEAISGIETQVFEFTNELFNAGFERNIQGLENELAAQEEAKEKRLAMVADDAQARAFIEQEYANKQKQIEKQIAEQKRKQAIFQKASDATQVVIQTAKGVATAVAESPITFGLPWSAFVAATGALQLARILAAPIPQYFTGTRYSQEGPAFVAERGPELEFSPSGDVRLHTTPSVANLERGSRIVDAPTTRHMLQKMQANDEYGFNQLVSNGYISAKDNMNSAPIVFDSVGIINAVDDMGYSVAKSIKNIPQPIWDEKGYRVHQQGINKRIDILNRRTTLQ
jgi:hypothetical protein